MSADTTFEGRQGTFRKSGTLCLIRRNPQKVSSFPPVRPGKSLQRPWQTVENINEKVQVSRLLLRSPSKEIQILNPNPWYH